MKLCCNLRPDNLPQTSDELSEIELVTCLPSNFWIFWMQVIVYMLKKQRLFLWMKNKNIICNMYLKDSAFNCLRCASKWLFWNKVDIAPYVWCLNVIWCSNSAETMKLYMNISRNENGDMNIVAELYFKKTVGITYSAKRREKRKSTLLETTISTENRPPQKEISSSNHLFSGAILVWGRVIIYHS